VIREELPRWRFGDEGQVLAGLERRRAAEINLFLS
jgi:GH24 family phage-related lysozyme (muramidase)